MRVYYIILVLIGFGFNVNAAQVPTSKKGKDTKPGHSNGDYSKANCPPSDGKLFMEFNDVRALIETGGSLWQNRSTNAAVYEVPLGSGNHVLYSGSIWMGGVDVNNQIKLAAVLFRSDGNDFWPGPLSVTAGTGDYDPSQPVGDDAVRDFGAATVDPDVCITYDKFFSIAKAEVINYTMAFECSQNPNCTDEFPVSNQAIQRINNWPAHGDVSRGQDFYLAPFYDYPSTPGGSGDGVYDPAQGDIPWFDDILGRDDVECGFDRRVTLFGDESNWWVFNDKGNIHTETGADPIGMEIHAQAFSFATNDAINQMTFYNYEMINRSTQTLTDTYFTQYADPDIGDSEDDFVGCDVSRGLGYAYNGDNNDTGQGGSAGYGDNPPAVGIDFFEGPYQDADGMDNPGPRMINSVMVPPDVDDALDSAGIVYSGIGIGYSDGIIDNERFGMRRFNYFNRQDLAPNPSMTDPVSTGDFYNYMVGHWKDNSDFVYGGTGYKGSVGSTTTKALYCYPGDSDPYRWGTAGVNPGFDGWSEKNVDGNNTSNTKGDRRFLQTAGPFTLTPGAVNNLTVGVVFGRAFTGDATESVNILLKNDSKAQALFDNCFEIMNPPQAPVLSIVELENELVLLLDNPYGNNKDEAYAVEDNINIPDPVDGSNIDKVYRFEGYQIYQMKDKASKVSDIGCDDCGDKARLVAQCDIKNGIASNIVNFDYNEKLGYSVPNKMVSSENKGIRHSFRITSDAFRNNTALVNHRTYYYIAIAYAFNEFKPYIPDDADFLDGQKQPYISSRLAADGSAIKAVAAIPHSPKPNFDGTIVQAPYGASPEITTLDGRGNGNRAMDLTPQSENFILKHGTIDTPTYQQGKGPIDIKVIDPLNLVDGYFRLTFDEYSSIDTASWTLNRYSKKGGELLGSVKSNVTIAVNNEQLIPKWGISVSIEQENYFCKMEDGLTCMPSEKMAAPIEATLSFADSSKRWLSGVPNVTSYSPQNWIASGENFASSDDDDPSKGIYNPACYPSQANADINNHFGNLINGTVSLGQLVRKNSCGFSPIGLPSSIGVDKGTFNVLQLLDLPSIYQTSVDIVYTSDKSKWTRCPVIELGEDPSMNINGGKPGLLRKSPSVDKNGNQLGDAGYKASEANPDGTTPTGMGWFPGYAIDIETGRRLNMAFCENSFLIGENGGDMIWNPSPNLTGKTGNPVMGGQHLIYVFGKINGDMPTYDEGAYIYTNLNAETKSGYKKVYKEMSWAVYPLSVQDEKLLSTEARMRIRINQEYKDYTMSGAFSDIPTYEWSMDNFRTIKRNEEALAEALDMINVVPNPYYAYSEYESGRLESQVKITNLPDKCKVRIYNTSGKLMRAFDKDSPITSLDWDLKNGDNIPVASGIYLIHVHVEGVGDRVIKLFGGMRQIDLENL